MAHVHGNKAAMSGMQSEVGGGTAKMSHAGMDQSPVGMTTREGMNNTMMTMGEGMMQCMEGAMKSGAAVTGVATAAAAKAGGGVLKRFFTHPLTLIGIGIAVGYLAHKYRHAILGNTSDDAQSS